MPPKRRVAKRRLDLRVEVEAWSDMFETGHDFFGALHDLGVTRHHQLIAPREVTEAQRAELLELALVAWRRLGTLFLETHPSPPDRPFGLYEGSGSRRMVKRRVGKARASRITPDAVAAFQMADGTPLHRLLGLKPWEPSPIDAVGECPWSSGSAGAISWPKVCALRTELIEALAEYDTDLRKSGTLPSTWFARKPSVVQN